MMSDQGIALGRPTLTKITKELPDQEGVDDVKIFSLVPIFITVGVLYIVSVIIIMAEIIITKYII